MLIGVCRFCISQRQWIDHHDWYKRLFYKGYGQDVNSNYLPISEKSVVGPIIRPWLPHHRENLHEHEKPNQFLEDTRQNIVHRTPACRQAGRHRTCYLPLSYLRYWTLPEFTSNAMTFPFLSLRKRMWLIHQCGAVN